MDTTNSKVVSRNGLSAAVPHHWRFKLRTLLLLTVAVSVGLAAMRYATAAWSSGIATATVIVVLAAAVMALCGPRDRRPFWIGFVIFGGGYLLFIVWALGSTLGMNNFGTYGYGAAPAPYYSAAPPPWDLSGGQWDVQRFANHLVTTRVVDLLFLKFHQPAGISYANPYYGSYSLPASYTPPAAYPATVIASPPPALSPTPMEQAVPSVTQGEPTPAPSTGPTRDIAPPEPTTVLVPHPATAASDSAQYVQPAAAQAVSDNGAASAGVAPKPIPDVPPESEPSATTPAATTSQPTPPTIAYPSSATYGTLGGFTPAAQPSLPWNSTQRIAYFTVIGHCLWAWILGGVGGLFARFAYWRAQASGSAA